MRALRLLAASTCLVTSVSYLFDVASFWRGILTVVAVAGAIAAVVVSRRDRDEQRLDHPPSIL